MRLVILCVLLFTARIAAAADAPDLYYLIFLRPDPGRQPLAQKDAERIQAAHMANIHDMAARGILVAAGPFGDAPPEISGIFVFKAASLEDARSIAAADPTVAERRNRVDVHPWRGPKGIGEEYFRLHQTHPETPEGMGIQPFCILLRGPAWKGNGADHEAALAAQDAWLERLRKSGKLAAGGAVEGDSDLVAVEIFKRIPLEEARSLLDESPAVKAGILRAEYHRWWCAEHVLPW